ncbi:conserved hypothetical protein [Verticillium alfalfae VaMs.102]|uniref:FAD dependent oxidoreductase domain-containing protein n=1 Tax=Verticillium alfalfae (strain VaMs.102 / ATCC MYA-4576 / FGSC 10136) TaxID=526221 RepID=C9S7M0_VERA1|nr:conserved hypothetical protein [Verticillium alfalfae VaMs.102]EEY14781.1 conserved hypothetical protein [Verticillium alfalfae VaMs.102]
MVDNLRAMYRWYLFNRVPKLKSLASPVVVFDALKGIRAALSLLSALSSEFNAALNRAGKPPGLPNPKPTRPYWLNNPPFPELVDIRSPVLPETADVAVIGSGIAGAAVVRSLLHERRRRGTVSGSESGLPGDDNIIVFEARQLCSGATARNGGHIKPTAYEIFPRFRKTYGPERAAALTRFQLRHIDCLTELCASEGIDAAEAREVETADLYLDEETFRKAVEGLAEMKEWVPEVDVEVWESDEARKKFGANESVVGALSYRAGAIWAYRFVVSIWKRLLDDFPEQLFVETMTPVEAISTISHISGIFPAVFPPKRGKGASVEHAWSGILGMTGDFLPFVGRLHSGLTGRKVASKKDGGVHGEWIAAGFAGEGMVWAWLSGTALGIMVDGCEEEELAAAPGRPKAKLWTGFQKS